MAFFQLAKVNTHENLFHRGKVTSSTNRLLFMFKKQKKRL